MSSDEEKRQRLLEFLDRHVFNPILHASPVDYPSEYQQQKLADVKRITQSERQRFHLYYRSAAEVKRNFQSDLSSRASRAIGRELAHLNLPSLTQVKEAFYRLCNELGV
ncbi:MAG: hypothetical protein WC383_09870 [Gammaproteobacteria bacterium]